MLLQPLYTPLLSDTVSPMAIQGSFAAIRPVKVPTSLQVLLPYRLSVALTLVFLKIVPVLFPPAGPGLLYV